MAQPIDIEILYFDGCPNVDLARKMVTDVVNQAGAKAQIAMVKIESNDDAEAKQFVGSPSIRVTGKDVDPMDDNNLQYSMRCRVYFTSDGMSGLPSRTKVLAAIEQALGQHGH